MITADDCRKMRLIASIIFASLSSAKSLESQLRIGVVTAETQTARQVGRVVDYDELLHKSPAYFDIFKQNKRDWLRAFETARNRAPTFDEEIAYTIGESTPRRLAIYDLPSCCSMSCSLRLFTALQEALVPAGVTPLLLNKFLGVARLRTGTAA